MNLNAMLEGVAKVRASDLHLKVGTPPTIRINSRLRPTNHAPLTTEDIRGVQDLIMPPRLKARLEESGGRGFRL